MNNPITNVSGLSPITQISKGIDKTESSKESFGDVFKKFVEDVNGLQVQADEQIDKLASGEINDVHNVMIAVEEANTAMEYMVEIRNKIVEAYQEIMRMQV